MTLISDTFWRLASRLTVAVLVLLLVLGARVGLGIRAYTGIVVASAPAGQNPNQSEEEERHEGHAKAAAHRRQSVGVPGLARTGTAPCPFATRPAPRLAAVTQARDHEADHRNGIGAPLRC